MYVLIISYSPGDIIFGEDRQMIQWSNKLK